MQVVKGQGVLDYHLEMVWHRVASTGGVFCMEVMDCSRKKVVPELICLNGSGVRG